MTWRFYAQRTTTGTWLHGDLPAAAEVTVELNGTGSANLTIPESLFDAVAVDGRPLFLERGTTIYAEQGESDLPFVGLVDRVRRTGAGPVVSVLGLSSVWDRIVYDGRFRQWEPHTKTLVEHLIENAAQQRHGDVGFHVVTENLGDGFAGDRQPPEPRPGKSKRRKHETRAQWRTRRTAHNKALTAWDKKYGDRQPYSLAWWEAQVIGDELRDLAGEVPFEFYERHAWTDRDRQEIRHELVLTSRRGVRRPELALIEDVNLASVVEPETDLDRYGNHLLALGAGEGKKMRRAELAREDGRVRTTRVIQHKHQHQQRRLNGTARRRFAHMRRANGLESAQVRGDLDGLNPGDEVPVQSSTFNGRARVGSITRRPATDSVDLTFID